MVHRVTQQKRPLYGRASMLDAVREHVECGARVVHLHGLGGIGKTRLLEALALCYPGATIEDDLEDQVRAETLRERMRHGGLWFVASRRRPGPRWAAAFGPDTYCAIEVGGLDIDGVSEVLRSRGVVSDPAPWLRASHGHPVLLIGLLDQGTPDLHACPGLALEMMDLLGLAGHPVVGRKALLLSALVHRISEPRLRALSEGGARSFDALIRSAWTELRPEGASLSPVVRDVVLAEARWRDLAGLLDTKARLAHHLASKLEATADSVRELLGLVERLERVATPVAGGPTKTRLLSGRLPSDPLGEAVARLGLRGRRPTLVVEDWDGSGETLVEVLVEALRRPDLGAIAFTGGEVRVYDLRCLGVSGWLRALVQPQSAAHPKVELLDQADFDEAVREALRTLVRPSHALVQTRFAGCVVAVRETVGAEPEHHDRLLAELLRRTIGEIPDPRARRATESTFSRGAPKQFAVATELGLSFATYRRALSKGSAEVVARLWAAESGH